MAPFYTHCFPQNSETLRLRNWPQHSRESKIYSPPQKSRIQKIHVNPASEAVVYGSKKRHRCFLDHSCRSSFCGVPLPPTLALLVAPPRVQDFERGPGRIAPRCRSRHRGRPGERLRVRRLLRGARRPSRASIPRGSVCSPSRRPGGARRTPR